MSDEIISNQRVNIIPADLLSDRLDRMEEKIDKLSDAMIQLARTEEKMISIEASNAVMSSRLDRHSQKIEELTHKTMSYEKTTNAISRAFWIVVTAAITVGITLFMGVN